MYFVPPHTALRKGLKEETSTPRLREIYCLDSLSLGSHRRRGAELAVGTPKAASAAPQETRGRLRRRRSARPASDPHLPRPEAGPRAPRGVRGCRREAGRPAGGRAGAEEVRPRCRPARFLPRPRQRRRGPDPRLPGPAAVRVPRTHSPSPVPAGQLSPARLSGASATKGGGTRHSGVPDTLNRPPESRALGTDHPPTHTHTGTFAASERDAGQPRTRHTPTRCESSGRLAARRSPNSHDTPSHIRPSPTSFPRESRSSAQRSGYYSKARKHSTSFSSSGPEGATAAISPRQGKHTHKHARARAHPAPTDASPPEPRPQTQTQTPTGGPRSRQPAPKGSRGGGDGRPGPDPSSRGTGAQSARAWGPPRACDPLLTCIQRAGVRAATAAAAAGRLLLVLRRRGRRRRRWRWG